MLGYRPRPASRDDHPGYGASRSDGLSGAAGRDPHHRAAAAGCGRRPGGAGRPGSSGSLPARDLETGDYTDLRPLLLAGRSISEPQFYAVGSAGALLLVGGLLGHVAHRRRWHLQGFVQACGTGMWPWAAGSALLSSARQPAWGWTPRAASWQPLFVPLVSVAPAIVVLYGPGWRVLVTAAVPGALLAPPAAILA